MKILVVGAGALGGYYGGRLLQAGRHVTFLVRPGRAKQIAQTGGLVISSPAGDVHLADPPLVTADKLTEHCDLIILACKATGLDDCIRDFAPAVGPETMIVPMLNGMRHLDVLVDRFGKSAILGGYCFISATLDAEGRIQHLSPAHRFEFGELAGGITSRIKEVEKNLCGVGFEGILSENILQKMWEKWIIIATMAGANCLMRAALGDIVRAGATSLPLNLLKESAAIAAANGYGPDEMFLARQTKSFSVPDSTHTASMLKDIEKGLPIEADHIFGNLIARIPLGTEADFPMLRLVYAHLKSYEMRRARELQ